jgi:hypothetical protein
VFVQAMPRRCPGGGLGSGVYTRTLAAFLLTGSDVIHYARLTAYYPRWRCPHMHAALDPYRLNYGCNREKVSELRGHAPPTPASLTLNLLSLHLLSRVALIAPAVEPALHVHDVRESRLFSERNTF